MVLRGLIHNHVIVLTNTLTNMVNPSKGLDEIRVRVSYPAEPPQDILSYSIDNADAR